MHWVLGIFRVSSSGLTFESRLRCGSGISYLRVTSCSRLALSALKAERQLLFLYCNICTRTFILDFDRWIHFPRTFSSLEHKIFWDRGKVVFGFVCDLGGQVVLKVGVVCAWSWASALVYLHSLINKLWT